MADRIDIELLARYLRTQATVAEAERVDRWIDRDPVRRDVIEGLRRSWGHAPVTAADTLVAWQRLPARVRDGIRRPSIVTPIRRTTAWRVAAAVAFVLGAGGLWSWHMHSVAVSPAAGHEYATRRGERAQVPLPDGSVALLAPESRLRVPVTFRDARDVDLVGEAYFEVAHDAARPFRVRTRDAVTRVLGTQFGVRSYGGDRTTEVAVRTGRVAVSATGVSPAAAPAATLTAGMLLRLEHGRVTVDSAGAGSRLAWTTGRLEFVNAALADVIAEANRWQTGTIKLGAPSLESARVTATFAIGRASDLATELAALVGGHVIQQGDTIYLTK